MASIIAGGLGILSGIGNVLGSVFRVFGTIFKVVTKVINGIVKAFKKFFDGIKKLIKGITNALKALIKFLVGAIKFLSKAFTTIFRTLFIVFTFTFHSFILFPIQSTYYFLKRNLNQGFDAPIKKSRPQLDLFLKRYALFLQEFRTFFTEFSKNALVILTVLFSTLIVGAVIIAILYALSLNPNLYVKVVVFIIDGIVSLKNFLLLGLNALVNFLAMISPLVNGIIDAIVPVLRLIIGTLCNPDLNFTGDVNVDCPLLISIFQTILMVFNLVIAMLNLLWQLLISIYTIIGAIVCPGGACPYQICQDFKQQDSCTFDVSIAIQWFFKVLTDIISFLFPLIRAVIYFIADMVFILTKLITTLTQAFRGNTDAMSQLINSNLANCVSGDPTSCFLITTIPQTGFTRFLYGLELFSYYFIVTITYSIRDWAVLVDYVICYTFRYFRACLLNNACYAIFAGNTCINFIYTGSSACTNVIKSSPICLFLTGLPQDSCVGQCQNCPYEFTPPFAAVFRFLVQLGVGVCKDCPPPPPDPFYAKVTNGPLTTDTITITTPEPFLVPCNSQESCTYCTEKYSIIYKDLFFRF